MESHGISRLLESADYDEWYRFFEINLDIHEKSCFLDEEDESNFRANDTSCDVVLGHGKS